MTLKEKKEEIKRLESKIEELKCDIELESEDIAYEERCKSRYLGKPIKINNEESGTYWITEVREVEWDGECVTFSGPYISLEESSEYHVGLKDDWEYAVLEALYSDPEYYNIDDWVEIFPSNEKLLQDAIECFKKSLHI